MSVGVLRGRPIGSEEGTSRTATQTAFEALVRSAESIVGDYLLTNLDPVTSRAVRAEITRRHGVEGDPAGGDGASGLNELAFQRSAAPRQAASSTPESPEGLPAGEKWGPASDDHWLPKREEDVTSRLPPHVITEGPAVS